jgi:hypothetical protein
MSAELDRERVSRLAENILHVIKANYEAGPIHRTRVLESLNALAIASAAILQGCNDIDADDFFLRALFRQKKAIKQGDFGSS